MSSRLNRLLSATQLPRHIRQCSHPTTPLSIPRCNARNAQRSLTVTNPRDICLSQQYRPWTSFPPHPTNTMSTFRFPLHRSFVQLAVRRLPVLVRVRSRPMLERCFQALDTYQAGGRHAITWRIDILAPCRRGGRPSDPPPQGGWAEPQRACSPVSRVWRHRRSDSLAVCARNPVPR